jgi:hypothetical protein
MQSPSLCLGCRGSLGPLQEIEDREGVLADVGTREKVWNRGDPAEPTNKVGIARLG